MIAAWAVMMILLASVAWLGQLLTTLAPKLAGEWGVAEKEENVDPVFWADVRAEALWDSLTLWTLLIAGILLLIDSLAWTPFGLVGGGVYVYFAGRSISQRAAMQHRGIRIGKPETTRLYLVALATWGLGGLVTIMLATWTLMGR